MVYLIDDAHDAALQFIIDNAEKLHICSSEPANYAGVAAVSLGEKSSPTITGPANGASSGRALTVAAIVASPVSTSGTATHYAIVDDTNTRLLVSNSLVTNVSVISGNTFSTQAMEITYPDPA